MHTYKNILFLDVFSTNIKKRIPSKKFLNLLLGWLQGKWGSGAITGDIGEKRKNVNSLQQTLYSLEPPVWYCTFILFSEFPVFIGMWHLLKTYDLPQHSVQLTVPTAREREREREAVNKVVWVLDGVWTVPHTWEPCYIWRVQNQHCVLCLWKFPKRERIIQVYKLFMWVTQKQLDVQILTS